MYVCKQIYMYVCSMYVCMYVIYMYVCMYVYMYVCKLKHFIFMSQATKSEGYSFRKLTFGTFQCTLACMVNPEICTILLCSSVIDIYLLVSCIYVLILICNNCNELL